jgi:hypothetical protein
MLKTDPSDADFLRVGILPALLPVTAIFLLSPRVYAPRS